jgi:hypothetical protein
MWSVRMNIEAALVKKTAKHDQRHEREKNMIQALGYLSPTVANVLSS